MSASFLSLSIFMFLPAPVKILVLFLGGFLFALKADGPREGAQAVPDIQKEIRVAVPVVAENAAKKSEIIINVKEGGVIVVDNKELTKAELTKKLAAVAAVQKDTALRIRSDAKVPYKKIVEVVDLSQKAGVSNISFATRIKKQTPIKP